MYEFHILMELLEGGDLEEYLKEQGRQSLKRVQEIGKQLLSALINLHEQHHIVHQDIKPKNLLFDKERKSLKIVDFGISSQVESKKTQNNTAQGTIRYMPPEQLDGVLTFKNDIWSFGCVLFQMATGLRPFDAIDNDLGVCMELSSNGSNPLKYLKDKGDDQVLSSDADFI